MQLCSTWNITDDDRIHPTRDFAEEYDEENIFQKLLLLFYEIATIVCVPNIFSPSIFKFLYIFRALASAIGFTRATGWKGTWRAKSLYCSSSCDPEGPSVYERKLFQLSLLQVLARYVLISYIFRFLVPMHLFIVSAILFTRAWYDVESDL